MKKLKLNFDVPYGACDTHHHIFNPKEFAPVDSDMRNIKEVGEWTDDRPPHTAEEYQEFMSATGVTHNIIVATSAYGYDVRSDLDAMKKLGPDTTRAILWFKPDVTDAQLEEWHKLGVRGSRAFMMFADKGEHSRILAPRLAELGWNLDFCFMKSKDFYEAIPFLEKLPGNIVIDHQALITDVNDKALPELIRLMKEHKVWVKLSGIFRYTDTPDFANNVAVSKALVEAAPERLLWATDWPHNWSDLSPIITTDETELGHDTGTLLKLLPEQIVDEKLRKMILVDNPAELYGFDLTK